MLMGTITAVFGGVLRDIVCNEIPRAFRDHRPDALCAFAGGWVLVLLRGIDWAATPAVAAAAGVATGLRILALALDFRLPPGRRAARQTNDRAADMADIWPTFGNPGFGNPGIRAVRNDPSRRSVASRARRQHLH
jgi:hypothetical protein